jgi:hypothetical protein
MYNNYPQNGVIIKPNVLAEGDNATVLYKGLLYHSGAQHVIMHAGYGESWNETKDIRMNKTSEGFEASIPVTSHDNLKLAFKDCANNWDNNAGRNYSFEVQNRYVSIDTRKTR